MLVSLQERFELLGCIQCGRCTAGCPVSFRTYLNVRKVVYEGTDRHGSEGRQGAPGGLELHDVLQLHRAMPEGRQADGTSSSASGPRPSRRARSSRRCATRSRARSSTATRGAAAAIRGRSGRTSCPSPSRLTAKPSRSSSTSAARPRTTRGRRRSRRRSSRSSRPQGVDVLDARDGGVVLRQRDQADGRGGALRAAGRREPRGFRRPRVGASSRVPRTA